VQQHQLIYSALQQAMSSEAIHALALNSSSQAVSESITSRYRFRSLMTLIESKMEKNYDSRTERAIDNLVNRTRLLFS